MKKINVCLIKLVYKFYLNKLFNLSEKKLIKLWNLFDIYNETEYELSVINYVLCRKYNGI